MLAVFFSTEALTASTSSLPATSEVYNFDLMGRVANNQQTVGDQSYSMSYGYNLGGAMTSEAYPSGRVVSYAFDDGARLSQVSSGATTYASNFVYGSRGTLSSMTLGNAAVESYDYNSRLQLSVLTVTKDSNVLQKYEHKYGVVQSDGTVDETKNTGQIGRIESWIGTSKQWQQRFSYDSLARLSSASEFRGDNGQQSYLVNYDYDQFGNRYQKQSSNQNNPFTQIWVEDNAFNLSTNRFASGLTYDDAGNVVVDQKFRQLKFQYDANNRQKQSSNLDDSNAVVSVFDAGGQRVATQVGSSLTNVLVYDAAGKLVAEYGSPASTGGTQYLFSDQQGSPRTVTNPSGAVVSRHDYLPYGEDLNAGVGLRSTNQGYSASDNARQKYAGMESDDVTGLDHTLWRQYDSSSGRWTSPDPYGGSMSVASPQTFNRYSYVSNDPVNSVDPTGLALSDIGVYQTENAAEAKYEEHNATWHTLRSATRPGLSGSLRARWVASVTRATAAKPLFSGSGAPQSPAQQNISGAGPASLSSHVNGVCSLLVQFTGPGFLERNGPGVSTVGQPGWGLGFTVSGADTEGGIGAFETGTDPDTGKPHRDVVNPHGTWTVQQWTYVSAINTYDDDPNNPSSIVQRVHPDAALKPFRRVEGDAFVYGDYPGAYLVVGSRNLISHQSFWDFDIKLIRYPQQCEVRFQVNMQLRNGHFQAFWHQVR